MQLLGRGVNGYTTLLLEINTIFQLSWGGVFFQLRYICVCYI